MTAEPTPRTDINHEAFRAILMDLRAQIRGDAKKIQQDALGVNNSMPTHLADAATDTHDQEFSLERLSCNSETMEEVEEALERLDDGSYGICVDCAVHIPERRLRIKPYAGLCIECQRKEEDH